jgi:hypothetical protein
MFYAISLGTSQKTLRSEAYVGELFKGSREVRRAALVDPTIAGTRRHQGKLRNIASQNGFCNCGKRKTTQTDRIAGLLQDPALHVRQQFSYHHPLPSF